MAIDLGWRLDRVVTRGSRWSETARVTGHMPLGDNPHTKWLQMSDTCTTTLILLDHHTPLHTLPPWSFLLQMSLEAAKTIHEISVISPDKVGPHFEAQPSWSCRTQTSFSQVVCEFVTGMTYVSISKRIFISPWDCLLVSSSKCVQDLPLDFVYRSLFQPAPSDALTAALYPIPKLPPHFQVELQKWPPISYMNFWF